VSLEDGSTLGWPIEDANDAAFGRPMAHGAKAPFPRYASVSLVENGTHVLFGKPKMALMGRAKMALAKASFSAGARYAVAGRTGISLASSFWQQAKRQRGRNCSGRIKKKLAVAWGGGGEQRLATVRILSRIYPLRPGPEAQKSHGVVVRGHRLIRLEGVAELTPSIAWSPTSLEPERLRPLKLAALYHERWRLKTALGY